MIEYVVARRRDTGELCTYMTHNRECWSAETIEQAKAHAKYISTKEKKEYKVYLIKEYND